MSSIRIENIGMLATPQGKGAKKGSEQGEIDILRNAGILIKDGEIENLFGDILLGAEEEAILLAQPQEKPVIQRKHGGEDIVIDARGSLVTPGLVDAHTHLIFGGWRQNELAMKLHGATYLEILEQGGGILSTVESTAAASEVQLARKAEQALDEMLSLGVTTVEAKSGYGLTTHDELKSLRVIRTLNDRHPIELVPTFLGAHALPPKYKDNREAYIRLLCDEMIPRVAEDNLAEYCDVFCEQGVFTVEESRQILEAGKRHGLLPKIHADEIEAIGASLLAGKIGAVSAEHLIVCQPAGIRAMAAAGTIACLLPATSFYLGANFAPAKNMIHTGVPVALASDFNPGSCPSLNLQFVMNLGCLKYKMTPEEVLTAVTLNATAAIGRSERIGTIEPGKQADLVIWNAPDLDYLCYRMGSNLAHTVIKAGRVVCENHC